MFTIEGWVYRTFNDVEEYGNPTSDLRVDCPFCDDYKKHLYISLDKEVAHCFKCGYKAGWLNLVMQVTGLTHYKALNELYTLPKAKFFPDVASNLIKGREHQPLVTDTGLPEDFAALETIDNIEGKPYKKYLKRRGFDEEVWRRYNLGIAQSVPSRIIIPIEAGYWQGRAIYKWLEPKYLNPKDPARNVLFNAVALKLYDEVVITEGAFSAMAVGDNAVALIGKEGTKEKLDRLCQSEVEHFIIALEPDAFGTMQHVADTLYCNNKKVTLWNYSQGDPAEPGARFEVIEYGYANKLRMLLK